MVVATLKHQQRHKKPTLVLTKAVLVFYIQLEDFEILISDTLASASLKAHKRDANLL